MIKRIVISPKDSKRALEFFDALGKKKEEVRKIREARVEKLEKLLPPKK